LLNNREITQSMKLFELRNSENNSNKRGTTTIGRTPYTKVKFLYYNFYIMIKDFLFHKHLTFFNLMINQNAHQEADSKR
jgi:hypothetical protein